MKPLLAFFILISIPVLFCLALYYSIKFMKHTYHSIFKSFFRQKRNYKSLRNKYDDYKNFKRVNFFEELIQYLSNICQLEQSLKVVEPFVARDFICIHFSSKKARKNNKVMADTVAFAKISIFLQQYKSDYPFLDINLEIHHGEPHWTGKEMLYNYPIQNEYITTEIINFEKTWNQILDKIFVVEVSELPKEVQEQHLSLYTYNKYYDILKREKLVS